MVFLIIGVYCILNIQSGDIDLEDCRYRAKEKWRYLRIKLDYLWLHGKTWAGGESKKEESEDAEEDGDGGHGLNVNVGTYGAFK